MGKNGFEFKSAMEREQVAEMLENLAASLRKGTVCAQQEPEHLTLKPADVISVEFSAAQKKGKEKLEIELSWRQETLAAEGETATLHISSTEPEPKPEPVKDEVKDKVEKAAEAVANKAEDKSAAPIKAPRKDDKKPEAKK